MLGALPCALIGRSWERPSAMESEFTHTHTCVYCRKALDPQDIIDCTPQPKAFSGEANISQTSTLTELKAPPEANTSGEA